MKYFRIKKTDGRIVGISTMSEADARLNLQEDEDLLPFDENVRKHHRWINGAWVEGPKPKDLSEDWSFMRRTGYPVVAEQLEAITDYLCFGDDTKLKALREKILATKADHPKK